MTRDQANQAVKLFADKDKLAQLKRTPYYNFRVLAFDFELPSEYRQPLYKEFQNLCDAYIQGIELQLKTLGVDPE